ncbi:MAG: large conductance mechanosensitive channel protein MscL [Bacteroidota bacterium]
MLKEFKAFILNGNVVQLAVGVVIALAFEGVIDSLVEDIIMPPVGVLLGGVDFSKLSLVLKDAVMENGEVVEEAVTWNYGNFINTLLNFLIIAAVVFFLVRIYNRLSGNNVEVEIEEEAEDILSDIREELRKWNSRNE